jgi:hypothetical protein
MGPNHIADRINGVSRESLLPLSTPAPSTFTQFANSIPTEAALALGFMGVAAVLFANRGPIMNAAGTYLVGRPGPSTTGTAAQEALLQAVTVHTPGGSEFLPAEPSNI